MTVDLRWLDEFVSKLPELKKRELTLFDTMGVSTRENTISTVLAYFLDETNPHSLGRLFLDSLLDCIKKQPADFPSPYTVERERHRIDILIRATDGTWAVVLENKVFHHLANPLATYLKKAQAGCTVGVVVSLKPLIDRERTQLGDFATVTHKEWLNRVQRNKDAQPVWPDDDKGRNELLYNDFIQTMNNNTASLTDDPETNRTIQHFQQQRVAIQKLLDAKDSAENYIQSHIDAVFNSNKYKRAGNKFYVCADGIDNGLRFYIENEILLANRLGIYYHLYGDKAHLGDTLKPLIADAVRTQNLTAPDFILGKKQYYHLAVLEPDKEPVMVSEQDSLSEQLQNLIGRFFTINETLGTSLVEYCRQFTSQNATSANEAIQ